MTGLPWSQVLYVQLEEVLAEIGEPKGSHFEMAVKCGKAKLAQQFGMLMDETSFYYVTQVLHPTWEMVWFKDK